MYDTTEMPRMETSTQAPTVLGYAWGVFVSLVVLASEQGTYAVVTSLGEHAGNAWLGTFILAMMFGLPLAAVIGTIGVLVVHVTTRAATSQVPAVLVAGAFGFVAMDIAARGFDLTLDAMLAVAAALGRIAAIPSARRRIAR